MNTTDTMAGFGLSVKKEFKINGAGGVDAVKAIGGINDMYINSSLKTRRGAAIRVRPIRDKIRRPDGELNT